jgi:predicted amidophosphoribosyltransferase
LLTGVEAMPDGLRRLRNTASLGQKTATEREREVAAAFAVRAGREDRLAGKAVVLIDDVMTSGATANACAAVLLDAGARWVDVLVAARVPSPRANEPDSQEH